MMLEMPALETTRLIIRPFEMGDLEEAHRLFDIELRYADMGSEMMGTLQERAGWLEWASRNPRQLAMLNQPPYGDRAIVLKTTGVLVGACGLVPCLSAFEQLPGFVPDGVGGRRCRYTPEVGLFYAVFPEHQRKGYAVEAALALIDYAFRSLNLKRIVAETGYDNPASQAVMRKLGMRIEHNPLSEPPWLQVVGVLENDLPRMEETHEHC